MHKLILPAIFGLFLVGTALAAIKLYTITTIVTSAFDFSINSIRTLDDVTIGYLEYGRATASVKAVDLNPGTGGYTKYEVH